MRILDKIKHAALPALAAVLVLGAAAGNSSSYFTTYVTARGGETVALRDVHVEVNDRWEGSAKNITVRNSGTPGVDGPCYVRAKGIQASTMEPAITYSGEGWFDGGDGWYYYSGILEPGQTAGVLYAQLSMPPQPGEKPIPSGTEFNVTVVTECAKIFYDEAGNAKPNGPSYEGWTLKEG